MKKTLNITASLYDAGLLKTLVEKLASRDTDNSFNHAIIPNQWVALNTSSTVAYVMGNFYLSTESNELNDQINMPFTTRFLFTCIKEKYGLFNLEWSSSLS